MPLLPIEIPSGVVKRGTELQSMGRWLDSNLVRWVNGTVQPVGGFGARLNSSGSAVNVVDLGNTRADDFAPRGAHSWEVSSGTSFFAFGTKDELTVHNGGGTGYDATPTDLATSGIEHSALATGYGSGYYGVEDYGAPRSASGVRSEATCWILDNFGDFLIAVQPTADGRLLLWDASTPTTRAAAITNAPTNNLGCISTEERFIFALGAGGDPKKVAWTDQTNYTTWTASSQNQAGFQILSTNGQIMNAKRTRGQTLIITDTDAHSARFVGQPLVFAFEKVGDACGMISRHAAVSAEEGVFWMGYNSFFVYRGNNVQKIPCEVEDYVFSDIQNDQRSKIWAWLNADHQEIWWFYQSESQNSATGEIDKYVAFHYGEGYWSVGQLSRTAGFPRGVFSKPMMTDRDGNLFEHEKETKVAGSFVESGPIQLGTGEEIMHVNKVIVDEKTQGSANFTFKTKLYPLDGSEVTHGPYTAGVPTDVRFNGRQIKIKISGVANQDYRVGVLRLSAYGGGTR